MIAMLNQYCGVLVWGEVDSDLAVVVAVGK